MPHSSPSSNCLRSTPLSQQSCKSHRWGRELLYFSREFQLIPNSGKGGGGQTGAQIKFVSVADLCKKQFWAINYQKIQITTTDKSHYSLVRIARIKGWPCQVPVRTQPLKFSGITSQPPEKILAASSQPAPETPFPGDFLGIYPRKGSPMTTEIVLPEFHGSCTCNSDNLETTQIHQQESA